MQSGGYPPLDKDIDREEWAWYILYFLMMFLWYTKDSEGYFWRMT
jgi:hypothetical protein